MAVPTPSALSRSHNIFDTALAAAVIVVAAAFLVFVYVRTGTGRLASYEFTAELPNGGGLSVGSDVRMSGLKVGSVSGLALDPVRYIALIRISLRDDIEVPVDSVVAIAVPMLGTSYLSVSPGRSDQLVRSQWILHGKSKDGRVSPAPPPDQIPRVSP